MNYAVIDVETTGLNPNIHEIIEVAIVTKDESYHAKVIPMNIEHASPKALEINGYNEKDWYGAVPAKDVAIRTAKMLDGKTIIGHNPSFDMSFLRELCRCLKQLKYLTDLLNFLLVSNKVNTRCRDNLLNQLLHVP